MTASSVGSGSVALSVPWPVSITALSPSMNRAWLHTGDFFRAGGIVAIAIGAVEEILSYWAGMARLARSEERRAVARDLHDGLAQELAYLVSQTQAPEARFAPPVWRRQVHSAAERALADSRQIIHALITDRTPPFEADLYRTATEVIGRASGSIELVTEGHLADTELAAARFAPGERESVLRIIREALTNAVRHSHATRITLSMGGAGERTLRVCDNGIGFDALTPTTADRGFGLTSMRERANSIGAVLAVRSTPGAGTTVEITWP